MQYYEVIGECEVAGVAPGGVVTSAQLEAARAKVPFLLGSHLRETTAPEPKVDPKKVVK